MNFNEEQQLIRHDADNAVKKKEQIETLEALLATHEAMGAEPDSRHIKELKQRIFRAAVSSSWPCAD